MFFDCMKVKLRSRRRLRPKSTIGCDIASFIQALVCPYFFPEESEKRKKCLSAIFYFNRSPIFLSHAEFLRARLTNIYHNNDDTRICSFSFDVRTFSSKQNGESLFLDVSKTSEV